MEMQIKITIRHQYKESKNKKLAIANVGEDMEKLKCSYIADGNGK